MNEFAEFNPGTWVDDPQGLATWMDEAQVLVSVRSTLKKFATKAMLALALGVGLSGAFAVLEPHGSTTDNVAWFSADGSGTRTGASRDVGPPSAASTSSASMFSAQAKVAGWDAAIALLRSTGEDIPTLLLTAAANVEEYGHGQHAFPAVFPKDEC